MALFEGRTGVSDNTPTCAGLLVVGAVAVLILLNRNLRSISAEVRVG